MEICRRALIHVLLVIIFFSDLCSSGMFGPTGGAYLGCQRMRMNHVFRNDLSNPVIQQNEYVFDRLTNPRRLWNTTQLVYRLNTQASFLEDEWEGLIQLIRTNLRRVTRHVSNSILVNNVTEFLSNQRALESLTRQLEVALLAMEEKNAKSRCLYVLKKSS